MSQTQIAIEFELLKVIHKHGVKRTEFFGIGNVREPYTAGHFQTIKDDADNTVEFKPFL